MPFVSDCGGRLKVTNSSGAVEMYELSLESIVSFATGMPEVPPLGFSPEPSVTFQSTSNFPSANTCSNELKLPLRPMSNEEFNYNMTYGILNTAGFGKI